MAFGADTMRYVITLSTIPSRFSSLGPTLRRLLRQSVKPEKVILYIPYAYRRFPDWDGVLPDVPEGVEIHRTDEDYGPATKILPAIKEFRGQDIDILFCDDDMVYRRTWAAGFLRERRHKPHACLAVCGHDVLGSPWEERVDKSLRRPVRTWRVTDLENYARMGVYWVKTRVLKQPTTHIGRRVHIFGGYRDIFEGHAGVMVRASFFSEDAFEIPDIMWSVDDCWLSGQAMKNGHPVWVVPRQIEPSSFALYKTDALHEAVLDGADRDQADRHTEAYFQETYGLWK